MKHLLFVQPKLQGVGGIEKVIPLVVSGLIKGGHKVSTVTLYGNVGDYQRNEQSNQTFLAKFRKIAGRFGWLLKVIKKEQPEAVIVSARGVSIIVLTLKLLGLIKSKVLVYEHQSLAVSDFGYGWLSKVMYEEADGFIAVSQGLQREINKEFPNKPCALAYNPVEANEIVNAPATNPIFVTASRLELVKGVDVLVRLFAEYKKAGGAGELRVYGDGSLENELRLFINQEKLSSSIKLMGVIDSLPKELADVTAYLSCARKESLGVSLLESIAAGVPIVCTDVEYGGREVMGIRYDEKLTYPFLSKVGVLISDEPTKEEFMTALNVIIREGAVMRVQAKERSRFFTVDKAVSEINIFLRLF